ncbi:MAG TPA: hypothetical protein VHO84_05255, partial [Syntrophorhabdaceae bacterium]|nr:hypothetical protein [Syntrophorhabdaceae bacterium]
MPKKVRVMFSFTVMLVFIVSASIPALSQTLNLTKTYSWKLVSPMSAGQNTDKGIVEFAKQLEQRTGGKVKIAMYEGTLGAPGDHWDMARNNAVQFAFTSDMYNTGRMPILSMLGLPMEVPDAKDAWTI